MNLNGLECLKLLTFYTFDSRQGYKRTHLFAVYEGSEGEEWTAS